MMSWWAPGGTGVVVLLPTTLAARLPSSCLMVVDSLNMSVSLSSSRRRFSCVTSSHLTQYLTLCHNTIN